MKSQGDELFGSVYERGETIFQEGEQGSSMFIIQSGAVEVTKHMHGRTVVLAQLEQGDFFGEMSLIDDSPRTATVRTLCKCRLLPFSKKSILSRIPEDPGIALHILSALSRRINKSNQLIQREHGHDVSAHSQYILDDTDACKAEDKEHVNVHEVHISENARQREYSRIFSSVQDSNMHVFEEGEIIFRQGDESTNLYVIVQGAVDIGIDQDDGQMILGRLGPGDCFGEMALLSEKQRSATARAAQHTHVLAVHRETFLNNIKTSPDLALSLIQLLILRLRRNVETVARVDDTASVTTALMHPLLKKDRPITLSMVSLSACSGCIINIIEERSELQHILEMTEIVNSPMLMDSYEISPADVTVIDGAVRSREERELLEELRSKSRYIVAWGTCAAFTGIPAYANSSELEELISESYGHTEDPYSHYLSGQAGVRRETYREDDMALLRKAGKLDDYVKVDFSLPGCPPRIELLSDLIRELRGDPPAEIDHAIVCSECSRKRTRCSAGSMDVFAESSAERKTCFISQGTVCLGFLTRGKCGAPCTEGGLPCWGCRGPSNAALKKMHQGSSYEQVLSESLQKSCKLPPENVMLTLNSLGSRCLSMVKFDHYFIHDPAKIR